MGRCRAMRSGTGWRTRCGRASSAPAVPSVPLSCSMRPASGGSCRARRSVGSTPTRRCSSEGCERCCCSRCTRWRWRASPSTATTGTIRGVGLQRTADFIAATTFGPAAEAERAVGIVRRVHEHVRGVAPDGRPYSALDPHLLRWVHLAEIDSFLAAHTHYGNHPLEGSDRDEYVAQTAFVARQLGVPAPPESERALRDQLRSYRSELQGTPRGPRGGAVPARAATDAARRSAGVRDARRRRGRAPAAVGPRSAAAALPADRRSASPCDPPATPSPGRCAGRLARRPTAAEPD